MQAATPESVWAMLQETDRIMREVAQSQKETDRKMQETDRQMKESERILTEKFAETAKQMKELQKTVGGITNNQGAFAEEYFFNSFEKGATNFFGEKFDEISKQLKSRRQGLEDEYDIVLYNHASIAIIEVKYKAHKNDVPDVLKKAETFKILYPYYQDFKIYLGLASMSFYPELEEECIKQGIAIIKQVGDTVVISDKHLKIF